MQQRGRKREKGGKVKMRKCGTTREKGGERAEKCVQSYGQACDCDGDLFYLFFFFFPRSLGLRCTLRMKGKREKGKGKRKGKEFPVCVRLSFFLTHTSYPLYFPSLPFSSLPFPHSFLPSSSLLPATYIHLSTLLLASSSSPFLLFTPDKWQPTGDRDRDTSLHFTSLPGNISSTMAPTIIESRKPQYLTAECISCNTPVEFLMPQTTGETIYIECYACKQVLSIDIQYPQKGAAASASTGTKSAPNSSSSSANNKTTSKPKKTGAGTDASPLETELYDILGVPVDATPAQIKKNYRALALQNHPDKNPDPDSHEKVNNMRLRHMSLR
ncbi:hypothetical protein BC939DRAFT_316076 [Gamsiella multidivaricata]|uniref:uncharacterized protein n=1 Tax=Gamsiella multidivaricata TaxID=101098 RepID=UPI0022211DBA|nr:uncharacterized protein BC939DRAFT_316076 [Gamsiella multidivaricata]KAI7817762.1 hypothetical protein BC939DRAFT_316076 [Gamsiella multidivaricata]